MKGWTLPSLSAGKDEGLSLISSPPTPPGCTELVVGSTPLTVSPFDWLLSPMSSGAVAVAAGSEWGALALSGPGDLRGGGCVFHQGRVGSAGPRSEKRDLAGPSLSFQAFHIL
uniref:Uncharacterized protein n=1 Tax=Chrysemys picta bellii TaxID=8478 RepID=A0A8C3FUK4_CHRPI